MTVQNAALVCLITSILSMSLAACCVVASWKTASRSTQLRKWVRSQLTTAPSDAKLNALSVDQAELSSSLSSLAKTVKRLSSRSGMEGLREERANAPPPPGTPKETLRKFYNVNGGFDARHQTNKDIP